MTIGKTRINYKCGYLIFVTEFVVQELGIALYFEG